MKKARLPNPPEGHYWRVERSSPDPRYRELRIFLMWRRPWYLGGDRIVSTALCWFPDSDCIADRAREILRDLETRRVIDGLLGDYPPKELP